MRQDRVISEPRPGFFEMRLVKGGPLVPAAIWIPCPIVRPDDEIDPDEWCRHYDRSSTRAMRAQIRGRPASVFRVWTTGRFVSKERFEYLDAVARWATEHDEHAPEAHPKKAVDLRRIPVPTFSKE